MAEASGPIEWSIDESSMLRGLRYHDGHLRSLRIDQHSVELVIDVAGGGQTSFEFYAAEFGSVGFVGRATIADVFAFPIHTSDDLGPELREAIHVLNGGMIPPDDLIAESRFMRDHHEDILFFFTCSYGGPFSIVCSRMTAASRGY